MPLISAFLSNRVSYRYDVHEYRSEDKTRQATFARHSSAKGRTRYSFSIDFRSSAYWHRRSLRPDVESFIAASIARDKGQPNDTFAD